MAGSRSYSHENISGIYMASKNSVNKFSQYMQAPSNRHWQAVERILGYLQGAMAHGLLFTPADHRSLTAFSDFDWGSSLEDRQSTSGFCKYLRGNLVDWSSSKKLSVVSRSTSEVNIVA